MTSSCLDDDLLTFFDFITFHYMGLPACYSDARNDVLLFHFTVNLYIAVM
jgi:hypothetical protein